MARKKKAPPDGPSNAYLISFGDTMTALLAFFIVINSLAQEQTGANLYTGTGSFVNALSTGGLPASHTSNASKNPFQKLNPGPLYVVNDSPDKTSGRIGSGPDEEKDPTRVVDRERDMLRRFLIEMENLADVKSIPNSTGQVVFDFFEPIQDSTPMVSENSLGVFRQAVSKATSSKYKIDIIVWARTPGIPSWRRAAKQAAALRDDMIERLGVPPALKKAVTSTGKPWFFAKERRPRFSISVQKFE